MGDGDTPASLNYIEADEKLKFRGGGTNFNNPLIDCAN